MCLHHGLLRLARALRGAEGPRGQPDGRLGRVQGRGVQDDRVGGMTLQRLTLASIFSNRYRYMYEH